MNFLFGKNAGNKTFKPKKNPGPEEQQQQQQQQHNLLELASRTLGSGDLRQAVRLPDGEDLNEWVAVNTGDFYGQVSMLYGTLTEFCTEEACPVMSAGPKFEYHWADGEKVKKPLRCSAPRYIDFLLTWAQEQLENESLFPSKVNVPFPKHFLQAVKVILKRLFRIYAHVYHSHFSQVCQLKEEAHLNTSFKHFVFFVKEFDLIDSKELAPLRDFIDKLSEQAEQQA